jgi:hypothetical protein
MLGAVELANDFGGSGLVDTKRRNATDLLRCIHSSKTPQSHVLLRFSHLGLLDLCEYYCRV